jgi:Tfp pilus assembly protein PilE
MSKLKSFTIVELIVSMLISSIVVSICYYAFIFFNKQLNHYMQKSAMLDSYLLFSKAIETDFEHAALIKDSAGSHLRLLDNSKKTQLVDYTLSHGYIVRVQNFSKDTFSLKNTIVKIEYVSDTLHIVKALHLQIVLDSAIANPIYIKYYTSRELMLAENQNNE